MWGSGQAKIGGFNMSKNVNKKEFLEDAYNFFFNFFKERANKYGKKSIRISKLTHLPFNQLRWFFLMK